VFEQSLRQLGWTVGRDLQIDYRSPGGDAASIRRDAAELVALAFTIRRGMEASGYPAGAAVFNQSFEECEQTCVQRSTCNVYTYSKRTGAGACYLYTRADIKPNPDFDSGVRNSVAPALPVDPSVTTASKSLFTIQRGVEASSLQGFSETFWSRSIEECEQKCAQQPACNVYTYKKPSLRCYLYSRADLGPNAEFDSGVRKSEVTVRQQGLFTIRNGMEAYGNQFTSFLAASFEQCQQNCSQRSICNIFTWSRSNRVCYLFERAELRQGGFFDSGVRN
jgi:hypothetical protein